MVWEVRYWAGKMVSATIKSPSDGPSVVFRSLTNFTFQEWHQLSFLGPDESSQTSHQMDRQCPFYLQGQINRVGQNRTSAPYMTVCMVISLLKIPYAPINVRFWPTLQITNKWSSASVLSRIGQPFIANYRNLQTRPPPLQNRKRKCIGTYEVNTPNPWANSVVCEPK